MMDGAVGKFLFRRAATIYYAGGFSFLLVLHGGGAWPPQLQLQQEQPQLVPHLQVLQSQPPPSVAASNPPELALLLAAAMTMVVVVVEEASTSGDILQPPHPLPHLQPESHPQLPPQQDISSR